MIATHSKAFEVAKNAVKKNHCVSLADVFSRKRTKAVVAARVSIIRALHAKGLSSVEIGKLLDRDHSTILSHLKGRNEPTNR